MAEFELGASLRLLHGWNSRQRSSLSKLHILEIILFRPNYQGLGDYTDNIQNGESLLFDFEKTLGMSNQFHQKKLRLALRALDNKVEFKNIKTSITFFIAQSSVFELKIGTRIWFGCYVGLLLARWYWTTRVQKVISRKSYRRQNPQLANNWWVDDSWGYEPGKETLITRNSFSAPLLVDKTRYRSTTNEWLQQGNDDLTSSIRWSSWVFLDSKWIYNWNLAEPVERWSLFRMMEWLRSIELAEFATNLRGTGVHGGLIALEPAFCDEHFATLLQMPVKKTLLRQHLQMKFQTLLDDEQIEVRQVKRGTFYLIFQSKKEHLVRNGMPMPLTARLKRRKKTSSFSLVRSRSSSNRDDELVCPLNLGKRRPSISVRVFKSFH